MKTLFILLGAIALLFIVAQLYFMATNQRIEQYPYKLIKDYESFEIRKYESSLFSSVTMNTDRYEQASGRGFNVLAGYIFGGNDRSEKIAMTSPVAMSLDDSMTMMFMIPKKYQKDELPAPNSSSIRFVEMPEKIVAAIRFGGWANDEKIQMYQEKLMALLKENNIKHTKKSYFLGYNAPYETVNRRNEIIIELTSEEDKS